jgi:hypothetical protein
MRGQVYEYEDLILVLKEDHSMRMFEDTGAGEDIRTLEGRCNRTLEKITRWET